MSSALNTDLVCMGQPSTSQDLPRKIKYMGRGEYLIYMAKAELGSLKDEYREKETEVVPI